MVAHYIIAFVRAYFRLRAPLVFVLTNFNVYIITILYRFIATWLYSLQLLINFDRSIGTSHINNTGRFVSSCVVYV